MRIVIQGKPIAKATPRFFRRGKMVGTYDAQAPDREAVSLIIRNSLEEYLKTIDEEKALELQDMIDAEAVAVSLWFMMPIPNRWSTRQRNINSWMQPPHTAKPDIDNMVKFYLDASSGILWDNDCAISALTVRKFYSPTPAVIMEIKPMAQKRSSRTEDILGAISIREAHALYEQLQTGLTSYAEGDVGAVADCLAEIAEIYCPKFKKICNIKKKHDNGDHAS